jgi:hypothetical protein
MATIVELQMIMNGFGSVKPSELLHVTAPHPWFFFTTSRCGDHELVGIS